MTEARLTKDELVVYCRDVVTGKISALKDEIDILQQSANDETKSSAGDKYETARAMVHLEIENRYSQSVELQKQLRVLDGIETTSNNSSARLGSIVRTNRGSFFLAISLGIVKIHQSPIAVISLDSPIGKALLGLKQSEAFVFNKLEYSIQEIY